MRTLIVLVAMCGAAYAQTPSNLQQLESDGTTTIAGGATAQGTTVIFRATLGAGGGPVPFPPIQCQLQVEVKPVGVAFDGTGLLTSGWANFPSTFSLPQSNIANGSYQWRARGSFQGGATSGWVNFPGGTDFVIGSSNTDPDAPQNIRLANPADGGTLPFGSTWNGDFIVEALATDPDGDMVSLEVYIAELGDAYPVTPTAESAAPASAGTLQVTVSAPAAGSWKVRVITRDQFGATSVAVEANGDEDSAADLVVSGSTGGGTTPGRSSDSSGGGCAASSGSTGGMAMALLALIFLISWRGRPSSSLPADGRETL